MKLLMMIAPPSRTDEVRALIGEQDVHAYTELNEVTGEGATGKHLGTHVWPGSSHLTFTVVPDDKAEELFRAIETFKSTLYPEEGFKAFVLPVEKCL